MVKKKKKAKKKATKKTTRKKADKKKTTKKTPKPLVKMAGKPMLEHIIEQAKLEGFVNFVISIFHLGDMIEDYFGNGDSIDVKIDYLREQSPLGTAGALSLFNPPPNAPFVMTNGDVMTDIRYGEM